MAYRVQLPLIQHSQGEEAVSEAASSATDQISPETSKVSAGNPILVDVPCVCDEKSHPHFRHYDGSGPGSGYVLDHSDPQQAHSSRNAAAAFSHTKPIVQADVDAQRVKLCLGQCARLMLHEWVGGQWICVTCATPSLSRAYAEYQPGKERVE